MNKNLLFFAMLYMVTPAIATQDSSKEPAAEPATEDAPQELTDPEETAPEEPKEEVKTPSPFDDLGPENELKDLISRDESTLSILQKSLSDFPKENPRATNQEILNNHIRVSYDILIIKKRLAHHNWKLKHPAPPKPTKKDEITAPNKVDTPEKQKTPT